MEGRKKILLVDDSDLVAGILTQFLDQAGYDIRRAKNGVEGIEMAYREVPDLIIMDVEMPLLQGYQASRLLKRRRGVKEIPIIMHTSLSEDRDKYWAFSSGANAFVNKDFDNLDNILAQVQELIDHEDYNRQLIEEDAGSITKDRIFEMIGSVLDQELFQSTIFNMLGEIGRTMGSLNVTISGILNLLSKVCEAHLAVLFIRYNKQAYAFILPGKNVVQGDVDDFFSVCLNDFYKHFSSLDLSQTKKVYFGVQEREDFKKMRIDNKKISSYTCLDLKGKGGAVVGTLHIGNFSNNYFSDFISRNISLFAEGVGIIVENSILFKQVTEMKDKIRHVFSKFVPSEIIDDLVEKQSDDDLMIGEKRKIVVLFSDIRSFTTISENNSAEAVVSFLNRYFNIQVNAIKQYGGSIDKFIGDAIFAIFGAPISYEDNAERAVNAALEMISRLKDVDASGLELPAGGFNIGIGLHEGEAIVGNIGSSDKFDYTAIGDTVNLAARLEGLTKHYKQHVLVSEDIKKKVEGRFFFREVDTVKVKGKDKPTSIYSVHHESGIYTDAFMDNYEKALKMYKMGNWDTAIELFQSASGLIEEDYVSKMFIERCRQFREEPPENWDGALSLDFK